MKAIQDLKTFNLNTNFDTKKDKEVKEIFKGAKRHLVEIKLQNGAVLPKHKAAVPITVLCLSGECALTSRRSNIGAGGSCISGSKGILSFRHGRHRIFVRQAWRDSP